MKSITLFALGGVSEYGKGITRRRNRFGWPSRGRSQAPSSVCASSESLDLQGGQPPPGTPPAPLWADGLVRGISTSRWQCSTHILQATRWTEGVFSTRYRLGNQPQLDSSNQDCGRCRASHCGHLHCVRIFPFSSMRARLADCGWPSSAGSWQTPPPQVNRPPTCPQPADVRVGDVMSRACPTVEANRNLRVFAELILCGATLLQRRSERPPIGHSHY